MIIWYNNSVLASIVSVLGCAGIIAAVTELMKGADSELSVPAAIGVIAVGVVCVILGKIISVNKEKKAQAAAQQANRAAAAPQPVSNAGYAQPQYVPQAASYTPAAAPAVTPVADEKPIKRAAVTAGIFFLLAFLLDLLATNLYGRFAIRFRMDFTRALPLVMCILLAVASFRTAATKEASVMHVMGFLGLLFNSTNIAMNSYRAHGFDSYITDQGIYHAMTLAPLLQAVAYLVLLLFAIFAMKKARQSVGGVVRVLWIVPILVLALVFAKEISDSHVIGLIEKMQERKHFTLRPEFVDAFSRLFILLGMFCTGLAFRRICKKPAQAPVYAQPQYAAPAQPQYTAPVQAEYTAPVQPQYEPQQAAPVPPPQPAAETYTAPQANPQDLEKKLQACKDLLDCGILTQEEYEQEVRKIMRG